MDMRCLHAGDASEAAALIRRAFAAQPVRTDPPSGALGETGATVASLLAAGGGAGATIEGVLVGCVLWEAALEWLTLGRLAVAPEWRRRGMAHVLIAAAEAEARHRGLPCLRLGVRLALADNRRLFAAQGFREIALTTHPGFEAPTSVTMEKRLVGDGVRT